MKKILRYIGLMSSLVGVIFLFNATSDITGFVIVEEIGKGVSSVLGIALVIGGLLILMSSRDEEGGLEKRTEKIAVRLKQAIDSGRIGTYDELVRMCKRLEYNIEKGGRHYVIKHEGHTVTAIPRHGKDVNRNTYISIEKAIYNETQKSA